MSDTLNQTVDIAVNVAAPPAPTDGLVDDWFRHNLHGLPISTDIFNHLQAAKELLKEQLRAAKG
jgi:hypothetical protein